MCVKERHAETQDQGGEHCVKAACTSTSLHYFHSDSDNKQATILSSPDNFKMTITQPEVVSRMRYETSVAFGVDESRRPAAAEAAPVESFRKLNVD